MEIPEWLKNPSNPPIPPFGKGGLGRILKGGKGGIKERFLDKTLRHVISFTEDTIFNERISRRKGLLQGIEPRVKIISLIVFIVLLSLQRSIDAVALFLVVSLSLALLSKVPLSLFLKRLFPIALFTTFIALPATLNLIVKGDPLLKIYKFNIPHQIDPVEIPAVISLTKEGIFSASMLILRVVTSTSIVFLVTLTTPPDRLIRSIIYFMPGALKPILSIIYRYIFFLLRRLEEFVISFRSRIISPRATRSFIRQRWIASRISLLFSLSLRLSQDLEKAMESRGYRKG